MAGRLRTGTLSIVKRMGARPSSTGVGLGLAAVLTAALLSGTAAPGASAATTPASASAASSVRPAIVSVHHLPDFPKSGSSVPTYQQCVAVGLLCYNPKQVRRMYGITKLLKARHDGRGVTIVIIDAFGSPTLGTDLKAFDKAFGLTAPPSLRILHPLGKPTYHESAGDEANWAAETSLDVEWSHAIAPAAKIDLLETKNDANFFTDAYHLEVYAFDHHLGKVLSQSWGTAEENLTGTARGRASVNAFEAIYRKMNRARWTIFAAAGDTGSGNFRGNGLVYSYPTVNFPASSPLLTSVGGTRVRASASGRWQNEVVWNEGTGDGATGGGVSRFFAEPSYQRVVKGRSQALLKGHRGVPDVSWDADPDTGVWVRCTAAASCQGSQPGDPYYGWALAGGTSAGSPQWAGMLADVDQAVGASIGPIDSDLYGLGHKHVGFHDITEGNNAYDGVAGFSARRGWDEASGWGTPGSRLASALIADGKRRR